jgi:hypothetical protein
MNATVQTAANDAPAGTAVVPVKQRAVQALAAGSAKTREELVALAKRHTGITAITGADGRADCHSAYMELRNVRVAIEKAGKDARDDATKFSKAVIEEEKSLVAIIDKEEERLKALRDAWDAEQERIRLAEAKKEADRVAAHMAVIENLRGLPTRLAGRGAAELEAKIIELDAAVFTGLEEFRAEAEAVSSAARTALAGMLAGAIKAEQDTAELERLRKESAERQAKEATEAAARAAEVAAKEAADRKAREAAIAAAHAELAKKAADEEARLAAMRKAEKERIHAERTEHDARMAAEARAQAELLANERAAREREAAEEKAKRDAEENRIAAQRAALERDRQASEARERDRLAALEAVDAKIAANAGRFYAVLVQLRDMLPPGTPEGDLVDVALTEAGF